MCACRVRCGSEPDTISVLVVHANTELGNLVKGTPELVIAGERLNVALLRRFYARHDFEPCGRPGKRKRIHS